MREMIFVVNGEMISSEAIYALAEIEEGKSIVITKKNGRLIAEPGEVATDWIESQGWDTILKILEHHYPEDLYPANCTSDLGTRTLKALRWMVKHKLETGGGKVR